MKRAEAIQTFTRAPTGPEPPQRLVEVTMPASGAPLGGAKVVAWHKRPGDWVEEDEPICLVRAEGLHAQLVSPTSGSLVKLLVGVGARIHNSSSLAELELPVASALEPPRVAPPASPAQPPATPPQAPFERQAPPEPPSQPEPAVPEVVHLSRFRSRDEDRLGAWWDARD